MKRYWMREGKTSGGRITCGHKHRSPEAANQCKGLDHKVSQHYVVSNEDTR